MQIRKKQLFRPRKVVFLFPFQTLLGAGTTLFRCFSSCPERHCKGRPFNCKLEKKQLFRPRKVVFSKSGFEPSTCLILATCALDLVNKVDVYFKAKRGAHRLKKKQLSGARKVVFSKSGLEPSNALFYPHAHSTWSTKLIFPVFKAKRVTHRLQKKQLFGA